MEYILSEMDSCAPARSADEEQETGSFNCVIEEDRSEARPLWDVPAAFAVDLFFYLYAA
jgi:hypothetical protein